MGKNYNSSRLVNGLSVDNNGNVAINSSVDVSYKLKVTGATFINGALTGTSATFSGDLRLDNGATDGGQLVLASSGFSDWNIDNFSGTLRNYYGSTVRYTLSNAGTGVFGSNLGVANQTPRSGGGLKVIESTNYVIEDNGDFGFKSNAYYNGTNNVYINTAAATRLYAGSGNFEFYTAPSGTAGTTATFTSRFYIANSGNVGIGTSSPSYKLDISAVGYGLQHYGDASNYLRTYCGSTYQIIEINGTNQFGYVGGNFFVQTGGTERMRITSGGNVLINDTSGTAKLLVTAGSTTEGTAHLQLGGSGYSAFHWLNGTAYYIGQNSQSRDLRIYSGNNTAVGVVLNPNATSWTGYSDERLKTNIENFGSVLENVLSLRTIKYHFKDVDEQDSQKRYGLIAQDLVGKFDEVLSKSKFSEDDETEYYGVRYTELIPVLVKAIQEQQAMIEAQQQQINQLINK